MTWQLPAAVYEHLVVLLLSGLWLLASSGYSYGSMLDPGPGFLPINLGVAGALVGVLGLTGEVRRASRSRGVSLSQDADRRGSGRTVGGSLTWPVVATIAGTVLFVGTLTIIGYGPAMTGLMVAYLLIGGLRLWYAAPTAIIGTLATWLLFERILELPLPGHFLDRLFGL